LACILKKDETFIDTEEGIYEFLPNLLELKKDAIDVVCDMEGGNLKGPPGSASFFQMTINSKGHTWVFDLTALGRKVFYLRRRRGQSIGAILEYDNYVTAWWDFRMDQQALKGHYGIILSRNTTLDVSYLELATRKGYHMHRLGLAAAVSREAAGSGFFTKEELNEWGIDNAKGKRFFKNNPKGYWVMEDRPASALVLKYTFGDTKAIAMLEDVYGPRMAQCKEWSTEDLRKEMRKSLEEVCSEDFNPNGYGHSFAPSFFSSHDDPYDDVYYY
jgi:hypothetical protein